MMHQCHVPQYTILQQKCTHVYTFQLQNRALCDIFLKHCGICEMGLFASLDSVAVDATTTVGGILHFNDGGVN